MAGDYAQDPTPVDPTYNIFLDQEPEPTHDEAFLRLGPLGTLPKIEPSPPLVPEAPRTLPTPPGRGPFAPLPKGPADTPPRRLPSPPRPDGPKPFDPENDAEMIPRPDPRKEVPAKPAAAFDLEVIGGPESINPYSEFPTSNDAEFARQYEFYYGRKDEAFLKGEKVSAIQGSIEGKTLKDAATGPRATVTPPAEVEKKFADLYTRAALVTQKLPLAKLGWDPEKLSFAVMDSNLNYAGAYNRPADLGYVEVQSPSTIVHESIHRGLNLLRKNPEAAQLIKAIPDEELAVRYLMYKNGGNPETGKGEGADRQIKQARDYYDNPDFPELNKARKGILDALDKLAQRLLKEKQPRGPR